MPKLPTACPDCEGGLEAIQFIDATESNPLAAEGIRHVQLAYALPESRGSLPLGKVPREGVVKGLMCVDCGRILVYGVTV